MRAITPVGQAGLVEQLKLLVDPGLGNTPSTSLGARLLRLPRAHMTIMGMFR